MSFLYLVFLASFCYWRPLWDCAARTVSGLVYSVYFEFGGLKEELVGTENKDV